MSGELLGPRDNDKLQDVLRRHRAQIQDILAEQFDEKRFARLITAQVNRVPALLSCTPISVINAVLHAASMGLEIRQNSAYLLPFKGQCQLIIDYRGKIDLAIRSGHVTDIEARLVYEKDSLDIEFGLEPKFKHVPNYDAEDRGKVRLGYAVAWIKEKRLPHVEAMSVSEINRIRDLSSAYQRDSSSPWHKHYDQQCRKTLIHRIFNYLPQSEAMSRSQEVDNAADTDLPMPALLVPDRPQDAEEPIIPVGREFQNQALEQSLLNAGVPADQAFDLTEDRREQQNAKEAQKDARREARRIPVLKDFPPAEQVTNGQRVYVRNKLYEFSAEHSAFHEVPPQTAPA